MLKLLCQWVVVWRREAIGNGVGHPGCFKGGARYITSIERVGQIANMFINHVEQRGIVWPGRVDVMPGLILGRTFALNAIGPVQTFKMENLFSARKSKATWYMRRNAAAGDAVDFLMHAHNAA